MKSIPNGDAFSLRRRLEEQWYELVQAEQRGASQQTLERLYRSYLDTVSQYNLLCGSLTSSRYHPS